MVAIISTLHQYVPTIKFTEELSVPAYNRQSRFLGLHFIIGGDQLTAARERAAQKAKLHADSPVKRLEGLVPVAEDWHTKVILLEVSVVICVMCIHVIVYVFCRLFGNISIQHGHQENIVLSTSYATN